MSSGKHFLTVGTAAILLAVAFGFAASPAQRHTESRTSHPGFLALDGLKNLSLLESRVFRGESLTPDEKATLERLATVHNGRRDRETHLDNVGGPDESGYVFIDNQGGDTATYNWIELRGDPQAAWINNWEWDNHDDAMAVDSFPIGFDFPFYGETYTRINVCTNGHIQFASRSPQFWDICPPVESMGPTILLYGDDLHLDYGGVPGGMDIIGYRNFGDYFVIEYDSIGHCCEPGGSFKFEAILYPSGRIKLQYDNLVFGEWWSLTHTIGIQQSATGASLQYVCDSVGVQPVNGLAIWFVQPAGVPNRVTDLQGLANGTTVSLAWNDPVSDNYGNPVAIDSVRIERDGERAGVVAAGVRGFSQTGVAIGSHEYNVRAYHGPFSSAAARVMVLVGSPSYSENFDLSNGGWQTTLGWEWGPPSNAAPHSSPNVWGDRLAGTYTDMACDEVGLALGLTVASAGASVEFYCWYWTEFWFDGVNFQASVDGGNTWEVLTPSIHPYDLPNAFNDCIGDSFPFWTGQTQSWVRVVIPIGQFVGQTPIFRFMFGSDGSVVYPGFLFDDFRIWGLATPAGVQVSGTITLDGGAGSLTQVVVRADGMGGPAASPNAGGAYRLQNVQAGQRMLTAELLRYAPASRTVLVPAGGIAGQNMTLRRLPPPAPGSLSAAQDVTGQIVTLHWNPSGDALVDRYKVYRKRRSEANWTNVRTVAALQATDTLPSANAWQYSVSAVDTNVTPPAVESPRSPVVQVLYGAVPPSNLAAQGNFDDHIHLSWAAPGEGPSPLFLQHDAGEAAAPEFEFSQRRASTLDEPNYYIVYRNGVDIAHPVTTSYNDMVAEGVAYTYHVTAHYPDGSESEATNPVTATAAMPPGAPQNLSGLPLDATHMRLSWLDPTVNQNGTSCTDLAGVRIYRNGLLIATMPAGVGQYTDTPPFPNRLSFWSARAIDEVPNEGPAATFMGSVIDQWLEGSYAWVDITPFAIPVVECDFCIEGPFSIGFPFTFYGSTYDSVRVTSSGFISFMNTWPSMDNEAIPTLWEPNNAIYAFWDDLNPAGGGQVLLDTSRADSQFVVSYIGVPHWNSTGSETFQIILRPDGSVHLNYQTIENNSSCTVGVENATGTVGLMAWNNGPVPGAEWEMASATAIDFWGPLPRYGDVAGHVTLDGGVGSVTEVSVSANGASHPVTHPDVSGDYVLSSVVVGNRILTATLEGYHQDTLHILVPDTLGLTNQNLILRRLNPPAPTGLTVTLNSVTGRDSLHWDVSPDTLVDQYRVYRKLRDSDTWALNRTVGPRSRNWAIDTLTVDGIYQYRVTAVDTNVTLPAVESGPSASVQVLFGEVPPERLIANGHFDNKIRLSWLPPGSAPATEVYYDSVDVDSTCLFNGLGFEGEYPFAWLAAHYQGQGEVRIERIRTRHWPWSQPGAPVQLAVFGDAGNGTPTLVPLGTTDTVITDPTAWLDVTLQTPVVIPGGSFFVGIRQVTAQRVDIGMDWCAAQHFNTFFFIVDTTIGGWMSLDTVGILEVLCMRAVVIGDMNGGLVELAPTPVQPPRAVAYAPTAQSSAKFAAKAEKGRTRQISVSARPSPVSAAVPLSPPRLARVQAAPSSFGRRIVSAQASASGGRGRRTLDDVVRYRIYRDGVRRDSVTALTTSWENTGLVENQSHSYYVTAVYDNGEASPPSNTVSAACNMEPGAPAVLSLTPVGRTQMRIQWTDPTLNADGTPCVDLAGIRVYRDGGLIGTVAAGSGQYVDTPPDPRAFYVWEVRGFDEVPNVGPGVSLRGAVQNPWRVVDYEWLDVWQQSTTVVQCGGCSEGPIDLGFAFTFYGQSYGFTYISSNGFLSFTSNFPWASGPIPNPWEPNAAIYAFSTDLLPDGGQCRYYSDPVHERFVVTYQNCPHWNSPALETFQVILEAEDGITLNYQLVGDPSWCLIGVENADGTDGMQLYWTGSGDFMPTSLSAVQFWGGPSGTIFGTVRAFQPNLPIADAQVWATGQPDTAVTDASGAYEMPVDAGTYTVNFHHPLYCDTSYSSVVVEDGGRTTLNALLRAPQAQFSNTSLSISTPRGVNAQTAFTLSNPGGQCPLSYSITDTSEWLSASPSSGEVPQNQSMTVTVSADVQGIPANSERHSTLMIEYNAAGSPRTMPVDLFVGPESAPPAAAIPTEFAYHSNYPNPFNATTTFSFDVPRESEVRIVIYDLTGREVARPVTGVWAAGCHRVTFDAGHLPSGMYLVRMSASDFHAIGKMLLLK